MGYSARLTAEPGGLTEHDAELLARDGLAPKPQQLDGPIHGFVLRDGQAIPYTLDINNFPAERQRVLPEQIVIAALLLASFVGPLCRLFS